MPKKRLLGFLLIPFLLVVGPGLVGGASAAPANCQTGALCGFIGANYAGTYGNLFQENSSLPYTAWIYVDSIYNNSTGCTATVYTGNNWTGSRLGLGVGGYVTDLLNQNYTFYHNIHSNSWC